MGLAESLTICVFGLGEAGSLLAADLQNAGAEVTAFDPAEVATPDGVKRFVHPALAVRSAELVLGVTGGAEAKLALLQSLEAIDRDAVYADLSTGSPQLKAELASYAAKRDLDFADVALMAMVPRAGLATPSLAAGPGAVRYSEIVNRLGGRVDLIDGPPGTAATKKLLRSVVMKGTAAVLVEALRAGAAVDDLDWLWSNIGQELAGADEDWLRRLATGSKLHARRRIAEMEAAASMLDHLEVPAVMTRATVASLLQLTEVEVPELPSPEPEPQAGDEDQGGDEPGDEAGDEPGDEDEGGDEPGDEAGDEPGDED